MNNEYFNRFDKNELIKVHGNAAKLVIEFTNNNIKDAAYLLFNYVYEFHKDKKAFAKSYILKRFRVLSSEEDAIMDYEDYAEDLFIMGVAIPITAPDNSLLVLEYMDE